MPNEVKSDVHSPCSPFNSSITTGLLPSVTGRPIQSDWPVCNCYQAICVPLTKLAQGPVLSKMNPLALVEDADDFLLLYNAARRRDIPFARRGNARMFNLDNRTDEECRSDFRFDKAFRFFATSSQSKFFFLFPAVAKGFTERTSRISNTSWVDEKRNRLLVIFKYVLS